MFQFPAFPSHTLWIHVWIRTHYCTWVAPFGDLRVDSYLHLTAAYGSLSRPSSAPSAKASALCSCSLDLVNMPSVSNSDGLSLLKISMKNLYDSGFLGILLKLQYYPLTTFVILV